MSILPNPVPSPGTIPARTPHPRWCDPRCCAVVDLDGRSLVSHRGDFYRDQWGAGVVAMQNEVLDSAGDVVSTCGAMLFVDVDPTFPMTPDRAADLGYALWTVPGWLDCESPPVGKVAR